MQTLYVKDSTGHTKAVQIIRSFQDISGKHIFLHANGTYGDRAGIPIKNVQELQTLPPEHRKVALSWWERIGKKQSETHYSTLAEKEAIRAGDFQETLAADEANSTLDSILYTRRPLENGKRGAVTDPKPWMEFGFTQRPDWWGQAKTVKFADCLYEMLEPESGKTNDSEYSPF